MTSTQALDRVTGLPVWVVAAAAVTTIVAAALQNWTAVLISFMAVAAFGVRLPFIRIAASWCDRMGLRFRSGRQEKRRIKLLAASLRASLSQEVRLKAGAAHVDDAIVDLVTITEECFVTEKQRPVTVVLKLQTGPDWFRCVHSRYADPNRLDAERMLAKEWAKRRRERTKREPGIRRKGSIAEWVRSNSRNLVFRTLLEAKEKTNYENASFEDRSDWFNSAALVPIRVDDEAVGVLGVDAYDEGVFRDEDCDLLEITGELIGFLLEMER